jgi:cell division protein FtsB
MVAKATVEANKKAGVRRRFNPSRLPVILFLVFLCYLIMIVGTQFMRLHTLERGVARAEQDLEHMKAQNMALWERVRLLQSNAYVESVAREKLGLVKPGEVPVVIQKSEDGSQTPEE